VKHPHAESSPAERKITAEDSEQLHFQGLPTAVVLDFTRF
jgi:hypothetical protein